MKAREVNTRIKALGGRELRQRGSHLIFRVDHTTGPIQTVVPQHTGDIPVGTLHSIQKDLEPAFGKGWLK
jgi:predicted RNA binding protein YcfA (HicA-like mRNA interferase family)